MLPAWQVNSAVLHDRLSQCQRVHETWPGSSQVMQVRCNRLLWSYEATRVETEHDQDAFSGYLKPAHSAIPAAATV